MQRRRYQPVWAATQMKNKEKESTEKSLEEVRNCHYGLSVIHLVSAIILLFTYLFIVPDKRQGVVHSDTLVTGGDETVIQIQRLGGYEIFWVLWPMPVLTGLFHILQAIMIHMEFGWYVDELEKKRNLIRWIEYSITASLMTWIVCQLSGMTNIYLVWTIGVMVNIAMQLQGYLYEVLDTRFKWVPMVAGFFLFVGQWSVIACYFFRTLNAAEGEVPFFVHVIFYGLLFSFLGFPIVQLTSSLYSWKIYEILFIVLSAVSKLLLDWTLFGGIISA